MSNNISLPSYVVRDAKGTPDVDATIAKFTTDLCAFVARDSADQDTIAEALCSVIATYPTVAALPVPMVVSAATAKVCSDPTAYSEVSDRVRTVLHVRQDLFVVSRGKNGGVSRKVETPATA